MSEGPLPHGTFSWTDATVPDQDAGKAFYSGLFGWDHEDIPMPEGGSYTIFRKGGKQVCGLSTTPPELAAQGIPPMWWSYVLVDDVDETTARAERLGGTVFNAPFDVEGAGRMSVIQDPTGGVVSLWEAREHQGAEVFNEHGALTWNELYTRSVPEAIAFYTELLGWTVNPEEMGGPEPYNVIMVGERPNGGIMRIDESWPDEVPPHWMVYFAVDDVDASVSRARELGGSVTVPPTDVGVGRFAVLRDDQGAAFTLFRSNA